MILWRCSNGKILTSAEKGPNSTTGQSNKCFAVLIKLRMDKHMVCMH